MNWVRTPNLKQQSDAILGSKDPKNQGRGNSILKTGTSNPIKGAPIFKTGTSTPEKREHQFEYSIKW